MIDLTAQVFPIKHDSQNGPTFFLYKYDSQNGPTFKKQFSDHYRSSNRLFSLSLYL